MTDYEIIREYNYRLTDIQKFIIVEMRKRNWDYASIGYFFGVSKQSVWSIVKNMGKMPTHLTSAYKDGHQWVVFCKKCGLDEPFESQECSERYVKAQKEFLERIKNEEKYHLYLD